MPLKRGKSAAVRKANIRELVHAGKPLKQAIAISYRVAGKSRKRWKVRRKR